MGNRLITYHLSLITLLLFVVSCANRGMGPQGGPKDETPPKVLKMVPENGSTNFEGQNVVLTFDEYVQLNDASNQVLISPPSQKQPTVKVVGKRVVVSFDEPLKDSTTYSINFGSAICDNNEKNPLADYVFSFSTGDIIDTLQVSGMLINAEDLNPVSGVYIGLHSNLHDSAFTTMPFSYITRTATDGSFCVRNVRAGRYRIYALNDVSKDFIFQTGEALAFLDTVFETVARVEIETLDISAPKDSTNITNSADSIKMADFIGHEDSVVRTDTLSVSPKYITHYEPSNILLRYFTENKQRTYFQRCIREQQNYFTLLFSAPQPSVPVLEWQQIALRDSLLRDSLGIDSIMPQKDMFVVQSSANRDTITIWIIDSLLITSDTIPFRMTYFATDSMYNLTQRTDTLSAIYRAPRMSAKAKEAAERKQKERKLEIKANASSSFDIFQPLLLQFSVPLAQIQRDSIHFYEVVDSVPHTLPLDIEQADSSGAVLRLMHPWVAERSYVLDCDSAAFADIYGVATDKQQIKWQIKSLDEYSSLMVKIEPYKQNMMLQLLSEKDEVVRTIPAKEGGSAFLYLKPQSYYLRMFEDANGDSVYTTGEWTTDVMPYKKRQPENVYYFSQKLTLRANWDFEETFNWQEKPILEQKPNDIKQDVNKKKK